MSAGGPPLDDVVFRSLAAPGLDEDDLFVALHGLPVRGSVWGEARGWTPAPVDPAWDEAAERRRRHRELMARWPPAPSREAPPGRLSPGSPPQG